MNTLDKLKMVKEVATTVKGSMSAYDSFCPRCRLRLLVFTKRCNIKVPQKDEDKVGIVEPVLTMTSHYPKLLCGACKPIYYAHINGAKKI